MIASAEEDSSVTPEPPPDRPHSTEPTETPSEEPASNELLYRQMGRQPVVEVTGIVDASGPGGCLIGDRKKWDFGFGFDAWRIKNGPVVKQPLYVRCQVSRRKMQSLMEKIDAETILKVRARVAMENCYACPQAWLKKIIKVEKNDQELNEHLVELQKPVFLEDDVFGAFTLDRGGISFVVQTDWNGSPVELRLWMIEPEKPEVLAGFAHALWKEQKTWNQRVLDQVAKELLPLKSENWQEDDGSTVSRQQFEARMTLVSITVSAGGDFTFQYTDGNLFFGHWIVVHGNLEKGVKAANIEG